MFVLSVFLAPIVLYGFYQFWSLKKNIASARANGLPYVVVPFSIANPFSLLLLALLKWIPQRRRGRYLDLLDSLEFTRGWHNGSKSFELMGASTFLAVSPGSNVLYTRDPDVSMHFLRAPSIGKPHQLLDILNIYGPTMTGTDGAQTRLYRRTTAPFFTDQTMRQVWAESTRGAGVFMSLFTEEAEASVVGDAKGAAKGAAYFAKRMRNVVARLTLHVVSSVCTRKEAIPNNTLTSVLRGEDQVPEGRQLTFSAAMHGVLESFGAIYFTPKFVLDHSPLRTHRKARLAFGELGQYLQDLKANGENEILTEKKGNDGNKSSPNLLDLLTQASVQSSLNPAEVLGNLFIFLFAGHEANANTLTFLFLLLACNPNAQRKAQQDVDKILPQLQNAADFASSISESSLYDSAYPALMESHIGACINEALRLYTVLPYFVKHVPITPHRDQADEQEGHVFTAEGNAHRIPSGTIVLINTTAAHTDPRYWLDKATRTEGSSRTSPVDSFNPELWFPNSTATDNKLDALDESSRFLRPKPGTFIPFSEYSRGCLGKRFALVELCAVVTRVLAEFSVELVAEDRQEWQKARDEAARVLLEDVEFDMSLRMVGKAPIRFVKRGEERVLWI